MGFLDGLLGKETYDTSREIPSSRDFPSKEIIISKKDLDGLSERFPFIFLDFHAHWCVPCKKMAPKIKWLARELKGEVLVCTVNVENEKEIADRFKVLSVPTYVLIHYGKVIGRWQGKTDINRISKELNGHCRRFKQQMNE